MAISSVRSYVNSYENLYTSNQTKKSETSETSEAKAEATKKATTTNILKIYRSKYHISNCRLGMGLIQIITVKSMLWMLILSFWRRCRMIRRQQRNTHSG